jgi:hypothetical protein
MIIRITLLSLVTLGGCAPLVGGIVGAAVSPIIEPLIDRALVPVHGEWVDPAGTDAVKTYDQKKPDDQKPE